MILVQRQARPHPHLDKLKALGGAILLALSDDLRKPQYRGHPNRLKGHCYVASEALYHLAGGQASGLKPMNVRHEDDQHWFLADEDGRIYDLTADQFSTPVPYNLARGRGFLTRQPSLRAQIVIQRVTK